MVELCRYCGVAIFRVESGDRNGWMHEYLGDAYGSYYYCTPGGIGFAMPRDLSTQMKDAIEDSLYG